MSRCPTQRDDSGGSVFMTTLRPKYRTVAALAPSQDSKRRTRPVCVKMEWDTNSVHAHRTRCQHPVLYGQVQSVQWVPRNDTGPVGGSPTRPRYQKVYTGARCDGSPLILERPKYTRQCPQKALDRPRMVYRAHGYNGPIGPREIRSDGALTTVRTRAVCLVKRDEQKVMA